jgi:D-glycero-alpha-D-manno-heptose-7-phosphate kinase
MEAFPLTVSASAPVRICDNGGWTDTWFAGHGRVLNIAVRPGVEVEVVATPGRGPVTLDTGAGPTPIALDGPRTGPDPLLEAAVRAAVLPEGVELAVRVSSAVPAGSATGTSAAVVVALLGALDALTPGRTGPDALAAAAHRVETEDLGLQSGVQDQLAAAHGGISFIEIDAYPDARVTPVLPPGGVREALQRRLSLLYLGRPHRSSEVHDAVVGRLEREGGGGAELEALRRAADGARRALVAGDLEALGAAMVDNTAAQAALHPALVGADARAVIEAARSAGASGWKVNGAGGDGGSLTLLSGPGPDDHDRLLAAVGVLGPPLRFLPVRLDGGGLRVTTS